MKKLLVAALVGVSLWVAAGPIPTIFRGDFSSVLGTNSTAAYGNTVVFPIGNSTVLGLGVGFASTGTNGMTVPLGIDKSIDAINWLPFALWTPTANGTTAVYYTTNFTSLGGDVAYIRVGTSTNANITSAITNLYLIGYTKPSAP